VVAEPVARQRVYMLLAPCNKRIAVYPLLKNSSLLGFVIRASGRFDASTGSMTASTSIVEQVDKQGKVPNIVCANLWWLSLSKPPLGFLALLLSVRFDKLIEHLWAFRCFDKLSNHRLNARLNSVGAFGISTHTLKQWRFFTSHYFGLF